MAEFLSMVLHNPCGMKGIATYWSANSKLSSRRKWGVENLTDSDDGDVGPDNESESND